MYSRLCMCDVCMEGRLPKGKQKQKKTRRKKQKMKRKKKRSKARGCALSMSLGDRQVPQGSVPPWT